MSLTWFIAHRLYDGGNRTRKASRTAIIIATAGVALGIAVMILSVSVALGFKREVQKKIVGIGNHIVVQNYKSSFSDDYQPIEISDSLISVIQSIPEVTHVQRFCVKSGMLKTNESFQGVAFRGIDEEYNLDFLRSILVDGLIDKPFSSKESSGRLIISERLARQLHLNVGDRVYAYFFEENLRARSFKVQAIYATNLSEYDNRLVFCDYYNCHQLLRFEDDQSSGAEVSISDMEQLSMVSDAIAGKINHKQDKYGQNYTSPTIKELYPHIFAWLDLLDLNVIIILALMIAVACFTTVSGLLIIILERTQFIGIMKALGSTNKRLRHIFIYFAILIIGRGMLVGNLLGIGFCLLQNRFGLIRLDASTYYVDAVPVEISWKWILFINIVTFLIATLALVIPSFLVSRIRPARSIRFE